MKQLITFAILFLFALNTCAAETIKFSSLINNSKSRETIRVLVRQFEAENPGLKVELHEKINDAYHKWMETWEQTNMDVIWWFAGFQLNEYAKKGSIEPIDDVWAEH